MTRSSTVQFKVKGKTVNGHLAKPEGGGPGLLVLHAWWGLKPFFKQLCDRLAGQGYVTLAPDLNNGQVADTIEAAKEIMGRRDFDLIRETVMTAKDALLADPHRKGEKIGVIGFSMGASWSLVLSAAAPQQVGAAVLFYGSEDVDFSQVKAKILGHYAENDEWEPLDSIRIMEKDMKAAGLDVSFYTYPNVGHWFVEDDRPEFDAAATNLAWERTLAFLKDNLV